ncbi:MAG: EutN/CcmL family microcompartment protein [Eubacterium sp.]|nr:EutN/CcmL family microcompartment protein [Eubacterium sp.]
MYAAKIIGTAVCTCKDRKLTGFKLLVVQPISLLTLENEGKPVVAVDSVDAGENEIVLVVGGSSARQTDLTTNTPVDATIMAVIDYIDINHKKVFEKYPGAGGNA